MNSAISARARSTVGESEQWGTLFAIRAYAAPHPLGITKRVKGSSPRRWASVWIRSQQSVAIYVVSGGKHDEIDAQPRPLLRADVDIEVDAVAICVGLALADDAGCVARVHKPKVIAKVDTRQPPQFMKRLIECEA